jgi:hypothetical protein
MTWPPLFLARHLGGGGDSDNLCPVRAPRLYHQQWALLAPLDSLQTDYRGLEHLLPVCSDLRRVPGRTKVAEHSTLGQAAPARLGPPRGVAASFAAALAPVSAAAGGFAPGRPRLN